MQEFQAQTILDTVPPSRRMNATVPQYIEADVEHYHPSFDTSKDTSVGPFYTTYVDENGDTYLLGGTVSGGNGGSATIADEKVLDAATGPGANVGKILYIQANCSATVSDGIMLPGCVLNSASLEDGTSVPDNHTFTVTNKTGSLYLEVGRWTATSFIPSAPGHALASGCIGNFSLSRI